MFDDYDYDCFDIDYAYEDFREATGHITNLSPSDEPLYVKAMEEYKAIVCPDANMWVGDGYKWPSTRGFYVLAPMGDLGPFWRIYEKLSGNP